MDSTHTDFGINMIYYNRNAGAYFNETVGLDMSRFYEPFVAALPPNGHILDAGCGSGRDTRAFVEMGYRVTAFDASEEMVVRARSYSGVHVQKRTFDEVDEVSVYDGIWSSASLLHVPEKNLPSVIARLSRSLKPGGTWFLSFKNGSGERVKDGRAFTDMDEPALKSIVESLGSLSINLVLPTISTLRGYEERWLNVFLGKLP